MLLYLATNLKSGLLDEAANEAGVTVKKLIGKFSLKSYVTKDMRNYSGAKYLAVDCSCVEEKLDDFILALRSFQMMFSARLIIILSDCANIDGYVDRLVSIGVVNLVTGETTDEVNRELAECFSKDGMKRYLPQPLFKERDETPKPVAEIYEPEPEIIVKYKWNARNIKIAIHGSQRRSGVTLTAFNFASWLRARGADVCYVEMNTHRHLSVIMNVYEARKAGEHYNVNGIDCYLTNELDRDYQFIIYDCGECGEQKQPIGVFKDAHARLLCGSILPYEAPVYHKAVAACEDLPVCKVALSVPQELKSFCADLFGEDVIISTASHSLFADNVNSHVYRPVVEEYIAGEARL